MPISRFRLLLCAACVACAFSARADTVYLKNGKTLEGEVVKDDGEVVVVRVTDGEVTLRAAEVEAIEKQSPLETRLALASRQLQLGNLERAVTLFEEAWRADRASIQARRALAGAYAQQAPKYLALHRFREARTACENLAQLDPQGQLVPHNAAQALKELNAQEREAEAKVQNARGLAAGGHWAQAIAAFQQALAFTPDVRASVAPDMAQCYVKRAMDCSRDGRTLNAAADLEAALTLDPSLGDKLESFYASCALPGILDSLSRGHVAAAQVDLKRVLEFAPTNRQALYVAGRTEEALSHLPAAANAYAQALGTRVGNPTREYTAELRQKLEAELGVSATSWKVDTTFAELTGYAASAGGPAQKLDTEYFQILHYNEALAREVAARAEAARQRIVAALNLPGWKGQARVYLHRTQAEYTARTGQAAWTGGFSRPLTMRGPLSELEIHSWQTSPRLLTSVLPHEIAHLVVDCSLRDVASLPMALHEGFAVAMEPQFRQGHFLDFLRLRLKSEHFIPLAELLALNSYPSDPEFFYAEGYALVAYLIQQKSLADVVGLLKTITSASRAPAEILRLSGAKSLEDLEKDWKAWIVKKE
ncbi:MAG: hypothetical protein NTW87_35155 [Planctomycetota bacterium]|nr:hypothetical protein [Planctomycetota bacterium]